MTVVDALVSIPDEEQVVLAGLDQHPQQMQGLGSEVLGFIDDNGRVRLMPVLSQQLRCTALSIVDLLQATARQLGPVLLEHWQTASRFARLSITPRPTRRAAR
jgi:hypothetical protein